MTEELPYSLDATAFTNALLARNQLEIRILWI